MMTRSKGQGPTFSERIARMRSEAQLLAWVFRDATLRNWRLAFSSVIFSTGSVACLGLALAMGIWYARAVGVDSPVELNGWTVEPRSSGLLLAMVSGGVFGLVGVSAGLDLVASRTAVAIQQRYHRYRVEVVAVELDRPGLFLVPPGAGPPRKRLSKLIGSDAALLGRVAREMIRMPGALVTVVVATAAIALIAPVGLLFMLVAGVLVGGSVFRANRSAARSSHEMEEARPRQANSTASILSDAAEGRSVADFDREGMAAVAQARARRMYAMADNRFASNIALAIAITLVIAGLGWKAMQDQGGWTSILAALVAINFAMANLKALSQGVIGLSRFHLHLARTREWTCSTARREPTPPTLRVTLASTVDDDPGTIVDEPGGTLLVVTPSDPDRLVAEDAVVQVLTNLGVDVGAVRRAMRTEIVDRGLVVIRPEESQLEGCPVFAVTSKRQASRGFEQLVDGLPDLRCVAVVDRQCGVDIGSAAWWRRGDCLESVDSGLDRIASDQDEDWDDE